MSTPATPAEEALKKQLRSLEDQHGNFAADMNDALCAWREANEPILEAYKREHTVYPGDGWPDAKVTNAWAAKRLEVLSAEVASLRGWAEIVLGWTNHKDPTVLDRDAIRSACLNALKLLP